MGDLRLDLLVLLLFVLVFCIDPYQSLHRDKEGTTPFMLACASGFKETAECILAMYNDQPPLACQTNDRGQTALMMMCRGDRYDIRAGLTFVELLVAQ